MKVEINNNIFDVVPLLTPKDVQQGMMFKRFDGSFDGLLFFMEREDHSFWMKNCLVGLDIIFIDGDKITTIREYCKPCKTKECETYSGFGDLVLELPAGICEKCNISEGDQVIFR